MSKKKDNISKKTEEFIRIKSKIMSDTAASMMEALHDRDLNISEIMSLLGAITAEVLLRGKLHGPHWLSFFASFSQTLMSNMANEDVRMEVYESTEESDGK